MNTKELVSWTLRRFLGRLTSSALGRRGDWRLLLWRSVLASETAIENERKRKKERKERKNGIVDIRRVFALAMGCASVASQP
jgi:hypothetical protein